MMNLKYFPLIGLLLATATPSAADVASPLNLAQLRQTAADFEHGRGIKQDYGLAFEMYCKAALAGDSESAYGLGFMYFNGRGVKRDLPLASHWFKQAADRGDHHAQTMLSRFGDAPATEDPACHPEPVVTVTVTDNNPNRQIVEAWVNQIAPVYGIDPQLVMAVIKAESAFNPTALSGKNAQGLMQLIPETAERFGIKDAWNPVQNIKGGTAYLHWLLRHFEGKVDLVLAAYNAGEKAVERYKGIPPYAETQNYVKQILAWYPNATHPIPPQSPQKNLVIEVKT
ncbi:MULTISPECIES: transglycosylase SLT domain-containing protein [unclassified Methylomonas]|uniref:transglycosylase SLT domain-containing protein n=1 Tax=unclassified Methylomonas TaxID=2608980 RepID=UPI0020C8C884|nr:MULTISPECIES: transglycosylase SLT domain-containing protein [unclassified Methylomonas]WGS86602.1 transglycosylase SLT domain-containing protein [Methylomonas sp. UP202]